jgi:YidC/Oxa1 family membrane protein insertase
MTDIWNLVIMQPMVNLLLGIYSILGHNFGLAIIIFTVLTRLATQPLTAQQMKSAKAMQDFQKSKKWLDLQEKYKNDREQLQREQMRLMGELGINPMKSCLPLLVQFPIIIGLYQAVTLALAVTPVQLLNFVEKIYPFFDASKLIPLNSHFLWMNLSAKDVILIPGVTLPFIEGIPILAIIVVITTYLQSKMMSMPSANPNDQTAQTMKIMNLYMPIFMGYIALTMASGLALYFVTSNVVGIILSLAMGQSNWRNLIPGYKGEAEAAPAPKAPSPSAKQAGEPEHKPSAAETKPAKTHPKHEKRASGQTKKSAAKGRKK